jgi:single-stranded DNA-binding protein
MTAVAKEARGKFCTPIKRALGRNFATARARDTANRSMFAAPQHEGLTMNQIECAAEVRLVTDVETRTSKAGKPYARFRAVVGNDDDAQWLQVTAIGEKAMEAIPGLAKSDRVYLEGQIKLERWQSQEGQERSGLGVLAWKVVPLGKIGRSKPARPRQGSDAAQRPTQSAQRRDWQRPNDTDSRPAGQREAVDDAIPF